MMTQVADAVASVRRANQVWYSQITEQETLDFGVALTCPEHPTLAAGNQLREVLLGPTRSVDEAFETVGAWYASRGLTCSSWTPSVEQAPAPLASFLSSRGYHEHRTHAMLLTRWTDITPAASVRIVPARAMRKALETVFAGSGDEIREDPEVYISATNDRIDDPTLDLFIALLDGEPAGVMDLLQVGDIGCIKTAYTRAAMRGRGVATTLLGHVLQMAQRLALRHICVEVDVSREPVARLFQRAGFESGGELVCFIRDR